MNDISSTFKQLRASGRIGLMPFIPAGYPDLETTAALLPALESAGASLIEVGFPFSDPIADGPVIQAAFTEALARGITVGDVFATVNRVKGRVSIPLVAMVSYSIVYRYGLARFLVDAKEAGFSGLILPDLPPPEAAGVCAKVSAAGLKNTLLVAPTTSEKRRSEIAALSDGFIYYLSVSGITGERASLPENITAQLKALRGVTERPVCVGFGISTRAHVEQLRGLADGAIVGSALVKRIAALKGKRADEVVGGAAAYCRELLGA